jgi:hypothetical protein
MLLLLLEPSSDCRLNLFIVDGSPHRNRWRSIACDSIGESFLLRLRVVMRHGGLEWKTLFLNASGKNDHLLFPVMGQGYSHYLFYTYIPLFRAWKHRSRRKADHGRRSPYQQRSMNVLPFLVHE